MSQMNLRGITLLGQKGDSLSYLDFLLPFAIKAISPLRFSHDATKMQTTKLLDLLRFYFHDVKEQLTTYIHTNFHSE